jgi:hypothetical protein
MKRITISRRALLAAACQIPAAIVFAVVSGCADKKPSAACANPDQLSDAERGMRASVQYTDQSPDPAKTCGGCAYFRRAADTADCGNCQILNSPVYAQGHCTSWSAKS